MSETRPTANALPAFERLLAETLPKAYGTAYHLTHSRDDAEDLLQEAAIQAFRSFHTFQLGTNFKAWFFRILINRFRNYCRHKRREPALSALDDAPELYLYLRSSQYATPDAGNPIEQVLERMTETQIHSAITALPQEYQIVCVLSFVEELAYQEIADLMDIPIGTVRSRLHRGRKMLQKALWSVAQEHRLLPPSHSKTEGATP